MGSLSCQLCAGLRPRSSLPCSLAKSGSASVGTDRREASGLDCTFLPGTDPGQLLGHHVHALLIDQSDLHLLPVLNILAVDLAQLQKVGLIPEESWRDEELLMLDVPLLLTRSEETPAEDAG